MSAFTSYNTQKLLNMNPLKLTLFFCFFTTILLGQQEVPGYIVKTEGDTLRGRITLKLEYIKFKQEDVVTEYSRSELLDYGYYGNRQFYPKPDKAPPSEESKITGTITLANGDTLQDFYIHSIRPDVIIGYFEYPKYILYKAEEKELLNLTISEGFRDASKYHFVASSLESKLKAGMLSGKNKPYVLVDLMQVNDFPKKGETYFMYAERVFEAEGGFRSYNISSRHPYYTEYKETLIAKFAGAVAPIATRIGEKVLAEKVLTRRIGDTSDWIIYKNEEIYTINNARDWKKNFDVIFEGEEKFAKYLKWQDVKTSNIVEVLKTYEVFKRESK